MKKWSFLLTISALTLWSVTIQAVTLCESDVCLRLASTDENPSQIRPGDNFSMTVAYTISEPENSSDELLAFGFTVNTSLNIAYQGYQLSDAFTDTSDVIQDVDVAGLAFPGIQDTAADSLFIGLATLNFQALATGLGTIGIGMDPESLNQGLIFLFRDTAVFNIEQTMTVVPLPGALFLFLNGLTVFALGGLLNRNKRLHSPY